MSQVQFFTKEGLEIIGGWDHPLLYFFLTIFDADGESIWSNLDHFAIDELTTTTALRRVLVEQDISPPEGFWDIVERKEGNFIYKWSKEEKVWYNT